MTTDGPCMAFEVYRWAGTTFEEFRKHYEDVHARTCTRGSG